MTKRNDNAKRLKALREELRSGKKTPKKKAKKEDKPKADKAPKASKKKESMMGKLKKIVKKD